ncbi:hypothetical protein ACVJH7_005526 [Bradyrhizobium elkanii]
MDEGREHAHRVGTAAEAEHPDPVTGLPRSAQEQVGAERVLVETGAESQPEQAAHLLLEASPGVLQADGAEAGMIIDPLPVILVGDAEQLQHVGNIVTDLVAGAVATNHNILRHPLPSRSP